MLIPFSEMESTFRQILIKHGMNAEDAALSAHLFTSSSADGVHSHGLNRFPRYVSMIDSGVVDIHRKAVLKERIGMIERWDGQHGAGDINAWIAMSRAVDVAEKNGVGVVALSNTNHWMRPGNYGIEAVRRDAIAILWTNTMPNLPPWGSSEPRIGNNPVVFAIPYKDTPVIVDVAMSMFSYGKLEKYRMDGEMCPVDGGFDENGNITRDPDAILRTRNLLPTGYWKGSGLSIALDLIAMCLSGGNGVKDISPVSEKETGLSQVFMAFSLSMFPDRAELERKIGETLSWIDSSAPRSEGIHIHYPGEGMKRTRDKSMAEGVYADDSVWEYVKTL